MAFGDDLLRALWLFLPAYIANMSPVFTAKVLPKWNTPIDFEGLHRDGKRVLGPGKTWRGLLVGGLLAGLTAMAQSVWAGSIFSDLDFGLSAGSGLYAVFLFGFLVGAVALTGDAVESYFKRRRNLARGASWFPFDQLDFVVFGLLAVFAFHPLLADGWVLRSYWTVWTLGTLLLGTPLLHLLVNRIGYWLKLKDVPW